MWANSRYRAFLDCKHLREASVNGITCEQCLVLLGIMLGGLMKWPD